MSTYETIRQQYRPAHIKALLVAESPPPPAQTGGSRHFYRTDKIRPDDRLFINTVRALYPETNDISVTQLEQQKVLWLHRFQNDGWYLIEALETSLQHSVTKAERQIQIKTALPHLIKRISELADKDTEIILIKSNVFIVASQPLRSAGFDVLNTALLDYPGRYNQSAYREKLSVYVTQDIKD